MTANPHTLLDEAAAADVQVVYMTGDEPGDGGIHGVRAWAADCGSWDEGQHWIGDGARSPVLKFHNALGEVVELRRASEWGFPADATPAECKAAMVNVDRLAGERIGAGSRCLLSPAFTGHEWLARSVNGDIAYSTLDDDMQNLLRRITPQGRNETIVIDDRTELANVIEYDGRVMYGAQCQELPTGPAMCDSVGEFAGWVPGRYRATITVPDDWHGVYGLIPLADDNETGNRWAWPAQPGRRFETWATDVELRQAIGFGWGAEIHERILWSRPIEKGRGPVGIWSDRLCRMLDDCQTDRVGHLTRRAVRMVLIAGIGGMHSAWRSVEHHTPVEQADDIPEDAGDMSINAGVITWTDRRANDHPQYSHPEWTTQIWGRTRAALIAHKVGGAIVGAAALEPRQIVAFRTDAVYLTGDRPDWPDDGKIGRLRLAGDWPGPHPAPHTYTDLARITDGAPA